MRFPTHTVFVVGAGASCPYGFPSGEKLKNMVLDGIASSSDRLWETTYVNGIAPEKVIAFGKALDISSARSIDEFVGRSRDFSNIAKACIASVLLGCERDVSNASPARSPYGCGDWLCHLFNSLFEGDGIRGIQRIRIVTFNFDRVIEHRVLQMLRAGFHLGAEAGTAAMAQLEMVHVNGSLGRLPWQPTAGIVNSEAVPFGEAGHFAVERAMKSIQFVHEDRTQVSIEHAKRLVGGAPLVCFLGFGFHRDNMAALGLEAGAAVPICKASGLGLTLSETTEIEGRLNGRLQVYGGADALDLLRHCPELHGYEGRASNGWNGERFRDAEVILRGDGRGLRQ